MNNSSLLEHSDFENEKAEIPPEPIKPPQTNTVIVNIRELVHR